MSSRFQIPVEVTGDPGGQKLAVGLARRDADEWGVHLDATELGSGGATAAAPRPDAFPSEPLTPELVMVSPPGFARWAREQLPDPSSAGLHRLRSVGREDRRGPRPRRVGVQTLLPLAALVPILALLGLATATERSEPDATRSEVAPPLTRANATPSRSRARSAMTRNVLARSGLRPAVAPAAYRSAPRRRATRGTGVVTKTDGVRQAASAGLGTTPSSVVLLWKAAGTAYGYWVALARMRSGRDEVVLTFETNEPRLVLPATWNNAGRRQRLIPGRYRWYVWFRARDGGRGAPVAQGTTTITKAQAATAA